MSLSSVSADPTVEGETHRSDFRRILYGRHSVRRYLPQAIPIVQIERLLDAACQAPSAHNCQPWRFVIVETEPLRHRLADAMAARFEEDLRRDGMVAEEIARHATRSRDRITHAPVLLVPCLTDEEMERYPDADRQAIELQMGVQSVAAAIGYLLLAAEAEGLAASWMCAPLFCPDVVVEVLELPAHWQPQAFITLGVAAEPARPKPRAMLASRMIRR